MENTKVYVTYISFPLKRQCKVHVLTAKKSKTAYVIKEKEKKINYQLVTEKY